MSIGRRCSARGSIKLPTRPYLSIPVANRMVTYDEHYALTRAQVDLFAVDRNAAAAFAQECRRRQHDDRLILPPGCDRGSEI